jgi:hypothetical protein
VTAVERLYQRWGWWRFVLLSVVFWVALWPVGVGWLIVAAIRRHRRLDKSPAARAARRIHRFLSWYPAQWRARYGPELEQLLHDTIDSGHGGVRLTLNMMRESAAAHRSMSMGSTIGALCWSLCWIPLVPQGVVPVILKLTHAPTRSWFLATYLPGSLQWLTIAAMLGIGLSMLVAATRLLPVHSWKAASNPTR